MFQNNLRKQYAAALTAKGILESRIRKYGFVFTIEQKQKGK